MLRDDLDFWTYFNHGIPMAYLTWHRLTMAYLWHSSGRCSMTKQSECFCWFLQINVVHNGSDKREAPRTIDPEGKRKAMKIDKMSRKLFPLAFVLFNLIYWIMYTLPTTKL